MKSKIVLRAPFTTLAAGAALAFVASHAQAESSVTLYGIVDAGLGYVSNAATATTTGKAGKPAVLTGNEAYGLYSGTWTGSRWGVLGEEDLGQGLSAIFRLENGFSVANGTLGQGSRMFGRHAYVGLKDKTYGTLTLGRQYDPLIDLVGSVGGTAIMSGVAATPGDVDTLGVSCVLVLMMFLLEAAGASPAWFWTCMSGFFLTILIQAGGSILRRRLVEDDFRRALWRSGARA